MPKISCRAKDKKGEPCRAAAGPGGLCYFHANPDRARTLGQIGGRKNNRSIGVDFRLPENTTVRDLFDVGVRTIKAVLAGGLYAREATALASLINVQARIIPLIELEKRIANLERQAAHVLQQHQAISQQGREPSVKLEREDEHTVGVASDPVTEEEAQPEGDPNSLQTMESRDAVEDDERAANMDTEPASASEAQTQGDSSSTEVN